MKSQAYSDRLAAARAAATERAVAALAAEGVEGGRAAVADAAKRKLAELAALPEFGPYRVNSANNVCRTVNAFCHRELR